MTPRDELLANRGLGPLGAELLYVVIHAVAVAYRFPPPTGYTRWDTSAVTDAAHDFLRDERGKRRLLDIALRSVDDVSFERILNAAVHNYFRDVARATDFGKVVRRVKEILHDEPDFDLLPGPQDRWALADAPIAAARTDPATLSAAIAGTEVVVPQWTSDHRDAPLADRPSFVRLIRAVLTAAGGGLPSVDIAYALTTRLDHRRVPLTTALDVLEAVSEPAKISAGNDPADAAVARLHAVQIFNSLSDRERILVPVLDGSVRNVAPLIGTGKSQAAEIHRRLKDRLRRELACDDAEHTMRVLCELCVGWLAHRTDTGGATLNRRGRNDRGDTS